MLDLRDDGGTAECEIFGAAGIASDGSFVFVKLASNVKDEEGFQVDPNQDGVYHGFKFVFTNTDVGGSNSKIYARSYVKGLL